MPDAPKADIVERKPTKRQIMAVVALLDNHAGREIAHAVTYRNHADKYGDNWTRRANRATARAVAYSSVASMLRAALNPGAEP